MIMKTRDYLFDNCKAFLIFLVVTAHFIGPSANNTAFLYVLKWLIVSFHMPAFIFISGYFSKRSASFRDLIRKLAVPYLIYEVLYYILYLILNKETSLSLLRPKFTLWYLMALFFWRLITPSVKKLPFRAYFPLAILAGLLIGCSSMPDNFMSIPRILVFYPFFLAGTITGRESITRMRAEKRTWAFWTMILIMFLISAAALSGKVSMTIFYGRYNYASMNQGILSGILCRMLCYAASFLLTYALLILMPERQLSVSYIGTRTMAVYLFHGLLFTVLKHAGLLRFADTPLKTALLLLLCAAVTWLFSWKPFTIFTNKISGAAK